jgi:hypothetical protein
MLTGISYRCPMIKTHVSRVVAPAVVLVAVAVTACGGGSPKAGVASLGTTTTTVRAATAPTASSSINGLLVKFGRCMRSHGVLNFPDDPASSGFNAAMRALKQSGAMSSPAFQAATVACARYAPPRTPPPPISTKDRADYLKAAVCMRNHGIVGFPDPVISGANVDFPIPQAMNTKSTQFLRAREICELLIPAGLPYSKAAENGQ